MENKYVLEKEIGKGLVMLANIVAGALVFGKAFDKEFDFIIFIIGFIFTIVFYTSAGIFFKRIK
ncbi:hypothetical protein KC799_11110 [candidate division KSB1 bacterium]|nr:hypothetical protein [candidate division KSB1 bacterium]